MFEKTNKFNPFKGLKKLFTAFFPYFRMGKNPPPPHLTISFNKRNDEFFLTIHFNNDTTSDQIR